MTTMIDSYVADAVRAGESRRTDPAWLVDRRRWALERFRTVGFPTTREEEWRFTSVTPIAEGGFVLAKDGASALRREDLEHVRLPAPTAATLVFANGRYVPALSETGALPRGVRVANLARSIGESADVVESHLTRAAAADRYAFTALNTAFLLDGAFVFVPAGVIVDAPIHCVFMSTAEEQPTAAHPRVLVVIGAGSRATIVESYSGRGSSAYFTNAVTEVFAGENATVDHYKLQQENAAAAHIGALYLRAERHAKVSCHSINLGGSLVRNDVVAVLDGEGGECALNGLYFGDQRTLVDNHT